MKIKHIISCLENIAPLDYQESYDNAGLITGNVDTEINKVLITLDCTEAVVDEAILKNCNLIVAHHPIVFGGLKKFSGQGYVEKTIVKAIKNDVAIYAIHTNLDNVIDGVNAQICNKIGLTNQRILLSKIGVLKKLIVYVPTAYLNKVREAAFEAGAGEIGNYSGCSFSVNGMGTFTANSNANAFVCKPNEPHQEAEIRIEFLVKSANQNTVIQAIKNVHPYEEMAFDLIAIENTSPEVGSGMIGEFEKAKTADEFLEHLKKSMNLKVIKYTPVNLPIKKVAVCGGAGSFLLKQALKMGADAFVSSDFKYHEFFDAQERLMVADIGHYESEIYTNQLLADAILKKFPTFAVILSEINTNPIKYYY